MEVQFVYFHWANITGQMKDNILHFKIFLYLQKYNYDAFQLSLKFENISTPNWTSKRNLLFEMNFKKT